MRVILTGSTGWVGGEVLDQCLANPEITSIITFTRRALPKAEEHPKLKTVIVEDFMKYSEEMLNELRDADGCIWYVYTSPFSCERLLTK